MRVGLVSSLAIILSGSASAVSMAYGQAVSAPAPPSTIPAHMSMLIARADYGDRNAMNTLGAIYMTGKDLAGASFPTDYAKAMRWLKLASDKGHAGAAMSIGHLYALGWGVAVDPAEAVRWYKIAVERGELRAARYIYEAYEKGEGVPKDPVQAAFWKSKYDQTLNRQVIETPG